MLTLVSCEGSTAPLPPAATTVSVTPSTLSLDALGATSQLSATVRDQGGQTMTGVTVTWASTAASVVTVSSAGLVTAAGNGAATVTATAGSAPPAQVVVTVQQVATALVKSAGDGQTGVSGGALATPIEVRVNDSRGNAVAGRTVAFSVTSGGGTVSTASTLTGSNGRASTAWTLGPNAGTQTVEASVSGLSGSPASFSATASNFSVSGVQPDTLVVGQTATITGIGFNLTPANNVVTIDGVAATVTSASQTALQFTVPADGCRPARAVGVQVAIGGSASNTVSAPLRPAEFLGLAVGEQQILLDPTTFCLQLPATSGTEAYLIGVQSRGEVASALTPTRLIARAAAGGSASSSLAVDPGTAFGTGAHDPIQPADERTLRWAAHREAEQKIRDFDERILSQLSGGASASSVGLMAGAAIDSTVAVGDTITTVRIQDGSTSCGGFNAITTVVRAVSQRSIWLEDVLNPSNGYTAADFAALGDWMDDIIYDTNVDYFGDPGDRDGNGRIVIVVTKRVNERRPESLGFVISCDFFTRASAPASNQGEFFYARAPDPDSIFGRRYPRERAVEDAPFLIAHELAHIIQFGRRIPANGTFTLWLFEGQATLAEEVVGHAVTSRTPLQNYGFAVAFNSPKNTPIDWYVDGFFDLLYYHGFIDQNNRHATAPHECTWVGDSDEGNTGPCEGERQVYGVPWTLFRWVSDHFGPAYPGGERGLHRDIVGNVNGGMTNLSQVVGVSADTLLAQWAAALYTDGRLGGANPRLSIPSWDLQNIFSALFATTRLAPTEVGFANFDLTRNVRDGSTAYFRVSGTNRPATAIEARTGADGVLAAKMNFWIVRLQ